MKLIPALAMIIVSASAPAQINKCLDPNGKVAGYGHECPAGMRSEASGIKAAAPPAPAAPGGAADTPSPPKSIAERDADFRKRQTEKQEAEAKIGKSSAEVEQRKLACAESQAYLKSLQSRNRIQRTDPKTGERVYLADAEYPAETAKTQQVVQSRCK